MPGIWNVNNGYNTNTKKISSKLTFEVGERFTGRVVDKGNGKDITIRLSDGWQFIGELNGNVDLDALKLVKFQVDGFENGKLKLKLVQDTADDEASGDENFQEVIEKEGLSKDDIDILKNMVKHNISLTRENINEIKGLIQFNEKVDANPKEIDSFIKTYLQSKGIAVDSSEGQAVKEMLTKFFDEFKKMSSGDILAFIENNLDFSEENINSFNKVFKGDATIEQILKKISNSLNALELSDKTKENKINESFINGKLFDKGSEVVRSTVDSHTAFASKIYNENDPLTKKINVLDVLRTLTGSEDSELDLIQKRAGNENVNLNREKSNIPTSLIEKLDDKEILKLIKDTIGDNVIADNAPKTQAEKLIESTNKSKLENLLSNIEGRDVKLTDDEYKKITELVNRKNDNQGNIQNTIQPKEVENNAMKDGLSKLNNQELLLRSNSSGKDGIISEMKDKINNIRYIVKDLIDKTELKQDGYEKVMNLLKANISDIKVFNSVSNEYYYVNVPITANFQEYPCKLIIKDNRKDGKKIDSTNAKMIVSVKTAHLGDVDGYLTIRNNKIDVNLKCENEFTSVINNNKYKLADGLSTLGLFVNIHVSTKEKPVDLVNCRNFFNDLTISAIDIKV
ncbi:flagellar hook-length control protein FliK [Clostridium saccharoperbutylacetonicum]|uniref:flagellar hook-length control protein FliK n=1 Tax=Clostridium saccharoperbutylacetonicum TaxID=36745 RepID=UPI0039E7BF09